MGGIAPPSEPWQGPVLLLNHTRVVIPEVTRAEKIVEKLLENYLWDDRPPARNTYGEEGDTEIAVRQPFTAWDLAQQRGQHDPRLWKVIKGSPYEAAYRRTFNPAD